MAAKVRLGRRSSGGSESKLYWQHYGLIDEVAIYKKALNASELSQAAAITGSEPDLLAAWTFDTGALPATVTRGVRLATVADVPNHVIGSSCSDQ